MSVFHHYYAEIDDLNEEEDDDFEGINDSEYFSSSDNSSGVKWEVPDDDDYKTTITIDNRTRTTTKKLKIAKENVISVNKLAGTAIDDFPQQQNRDFLSYSAEQTLALFFKKQESARWVKYYMVERINRGLCICGKDKIENETELYKFLLFLVTCHFFDASPTQLEDQRLKDLFGFEQLMTKSRFLDILASLGRQEEVSANNERWAENGEIISELLNAMNSFSAVSSKLVMNQNGITNLAVDDDKVHHRSKTAKDYNLRVEYQRGGNLGPTIMMCVNNDTQFIGSCRLVQERESSVDVASNCIAICHSKITDSSIDRISSLRNSHFAIDRGLMTKKMISKLTAKGKSCFNAVVKYVQ